MDLDKVWEMGIVHTLNDLSYLKAKASHDKEIFKKSLNK